MMGTTLTKTWMMKIWPLPSQRQKESRKHHRYDLATLPMSQNNAKKTLKTDTFYLHPHLLSIRPIEKLLFKSRSPLLLLLKEWLILLNKSTSRYTLSIIYYTVDFSFFTSINDIWPLREVFDLILLSQNFFETQQYRNSTVHIYYTAWNNLPPLFFLRKRPSSNYRHAICITHHAMRR